ncbi:hypothetical protein Syun_006870 [Stephania yunnanensis]|uniref:Uncharacterized protein n=1 Tax=Stephania yunnanensis TaxID=152371 RepID=A0AAP0L0U2_9MAGN
MMAQVEDRESDSERAKSSGDEDHYVDGDQSRSGSSVSVGDNKEDEGKEGGDNNSEEDGGDDGDEDGEDIGKSNVEGAAKRSDKINRGKKVGAVLYAFIIIPSASHLRYILANNPRSHTP